MQYASHLVGTTSHFDGAKEEHMNASRRNQILYWTLTLLVLLPTAGSAVPELFTASPQSTVRAYHNGDAQQRWHPARPLRDRIWLLMRPDRVVRAHHCASLFRRFADVLLQLIVCLNIVQLRLQQQSIGLKFLGDCGLGLRAKQAPVSQLRSGYPSGFFAECH